MTSTIAAIATAPGNGGIGIIRVSGKDAIEIVNRIFLSKKEGFSLLNVESHTIHYGHIYDGDELVDEVLVSVFIAPRSFTAENVIEINCHGGVFVINRILALVLKNGARAAEPGEFTKRAFLNGRIDLSQAEAVIDIINAKNEFSLKNSLKHLNGSVHRMIIEMREKIIHETAFIEAALDDPEHYDIDEHTDELVENINSIKYGIEKIIKNYNNSRIMKDGINTLIVGKPNVGKSSLLNALSGRDRAIVTDIAGTTRDIIEETVSLDGINLNLIDTAGIRDTIDTVEKIGVDKAISCIEEADMILFLIDKSVPVDDNDRKIAKIIDINKTILLYNKSDKEPYDNDYEFLDEFDSITLSAKNEEGLDILSEKIKNMFFTNKISYDEEIYLTNARQKEMIDNAYLSITHVIESIEGMMPEDFWTIDLMNAYTYLGSVIGIDLSDDLVDRVFSEFCMGK